MTKKLGFRCLAQLGDVNPLDYGGCWILQYLTGNYAPDMEILIIPEEEEGEKPQKYLTYRFPLEQCFFENGILSDNKFHKDFPAWFADNLEDVASSCGVPHEDLVNQLCSDDPIERGQAYSSLVGYFGYEEFDHYPLELSWSEVVARYCPSRKKGKLRKEYSVDTSPRLEAGYAFQSSSRHPKEPKTIIVSSQEIAEASYVGNAMIDGCLHNAFKVYNKSRYYFQVKLDR